MSRPSRILPFIRDLNPQQDDLPTLIGLAKEHEGNREALVAAVYEQWTVRSGRRNFSLHSIEANTIPSLGAENLGIIDVDGTLTEIGEALWHVRDDLSRFKDLLAVHILQKRAGWQFTRALDVLVRRGRRPTREAIAAYLQEKYGIGEWRDLNNISSLHSFLEWTGVVTNYRLNHSEFERLLGTSVEEISILEGFSQETRGCLEALVRLGGVAQAGVIRQAAESYLRRPLDANQFTGRMRPLIDAGLVTFQGTRGSRTSTYAIQDERKAAILAAISTELAMVGVVPDEVFEADFSSAVESVHDGRLTPDAKGRALEVLAAMILVRLGLKHILVRNRTEFEVDVTAEYVGTSYQAWSVQCKAFGRSQVRSEHILRELGIGVLNHYSVLLFVTTSTFTDDALMTANRIARETPLQVLRLDGEDLDAIAANEALLFRRIREKSEAVRRLRVGAHPVEVFEEFYAAKDWIISEQPGSAEVWAYLQRRDILVERHVAAGLLYAWLESQRGTPGLDEDYLERIKAER